MLQWIAMTTMLIDHIGMMFFPEQTAYRIIGRLAFPLYCWFLVQGYFHTRSLGRYMRRLLALACLSQIPYSLATGRWELNVIFTLLLSLTALYALDRVQPEWKKLLAIAALLCVFAAVPMDYGVYGLLLVLVYRYLDKWKLLPGHMLIDAAYWALSGPGYGLQLFSALGSLLVVLPVPERMSARTRWIYRAFYPAHLAVLYLIWAGLQQP